jgi:hypothetical protein
MRRPGSPATPWPAKVCSTPAVAWRMRALTTLSLVLFLAGCAGTTAEPQDPAATAEPSTPAEPQAAVSANGLRWTITAHPAQLTMAERATFRLRRTVTNEASEPRDAMRAMASFTFNGEASMSLDMAFGNGAREDRWAALPPGESAFDEREMGESLFPAPGTYVIAMTVDGVTSTVEVRVSP